MFLLGVALVVAAGLFPVLRPAFLKAGKSVPLDMATTIQIVMLSMAALILAVTRVPAGNVPKTPSSQAGVTAVVGSSGSRGSGTRSSRRTRSSSSARSANSRRRTRSSSPWGSSSPRSSSSARRRRRGRSCRWDQPGPSLLDAHRLVARGERLLLPATYGTIIAAINFDRSGTTRIGRFVLNHSFMLPGLVATGTAVAVGLLIAKFLL